MLPRRLQKERQSFQALAEGTRAELVRGRGIAPDP